MHLSVYTNGDYKIYFNGIDLNCEIVDNILYKKFINGYIQDVESRRLFMSLLTNTTRIPEIDNNLFVNGETTTCLAFAYNENAVALSLKRKNIFCGEYIICNCNNQDFEVRNIAEESHIVTHAQHIIVRKYEPNPKHGPKSYYRSGGIKVSPMQLSDTDVQSVLNHAFDYKRRLLGMKDNCIYEFRRTRDYIYHGYNITEDFNIDERKQIVEVFENVED